MNRKRRIDPKSAVVDELLRTFATVPVTSVPAGEFLTAADFAALIGIDARSVGDLLTKLGVTRSQRRGYRLDEICEAAARVARTVDYEVQPSQEGRAMRAAALSILSTFYEME